MSTDQFLSLTTPVLRMVQGNAFVPREKDMQGNPLVVKTGPNAGQPRKEWFIAGAIAKGTAEFNDLWGKISAFGRQCWPQHFDAAGNCTHPAFSWKMVDGDGVDQNGQPNSAKEGFAGHYVFRMSSGFAPKVFHAGRYAPSEQVLDPAALRNGYYIRCLVNVKSNTNPQKPGLFINIQMVEISGHGAEITSGPDAGAAFAGGPGSLPPGASAAPIAGAPLATLPGGPAPAAPAPGGYAPAPAAPAPTAAPVVPYTGYMQPGAAPAVPGMAPPAPPPAAPPAPPAPAAGPQMTAAANGVAYEAYRQSGWTDEQLRAAGMMV